MYTLLKNKSLLFFCVSIPIYAVLGLLVLEIIVRAFSYYQWYTPLAEYPEILERFERTRSSFVPIQKEHLRAYPQDLPAPIHLKNGLHIPFSWTSYAKFPASAFRSPPKNEKPDKSKIRIVFIGGSTTFLGYPEIVSDLLSAEFGKDKIEVINMGVPGASSRTSFVLMKRFLKKWRPDIAVIYHGMNDLVFLGVEQRIRMEAFSLSKTDVATLCGVGTSSKGLYSLISDNSLNDFFPFGIMEDSKNIIELADNYLAMSKLLKELSITAFFSSFASPDYQNLSEFDYQFYDLSIKYIWPILRSADQYEKAIASYNCVVKEVAQTENIGLIDIVNKISGSRDWFEDNCHRTDKGIQEHGRLVFQAISQAVKNKLYKKNSEPDNQKANKDKTDLFDYELLVDKCMQ